MWKTEYMLGFETVDNQHKSLFIMTNHLLKNVIKSADHASRRNECVNLILYLKGYSIQHFETEEEYMRFINYCDIEAHKEIHKSFVNTVLDLEQKMLKADYSLPCLKEFAGFLTAWLTYHIAGADQKLKRNEPLSVPGPDINSYISCFAQSADTVMKQMLSSIAPNVIYTTEPVNKQDIVIQIGLIGTRECTAVFVFPLETTVALIEAMTHLTLDTIDEIAYSALSEIVNIISGNAATLITQSGRICDIKPPQVIYGDAPAISEDGFQFDTEYGRISIYINS